MIVFQLTLSGGMLRTLVAINSGYEFEKIRDHAHFITHVRALRREGLITHEPPLHVDEARKLGREFRDPKRRCAYEITRKGQIALELAAMDLRDFLDEVRHEITGESRPKKLAGKKR